MVRIINVKSPKHLHRQVEVAIDGDVILSMKLVNIHLRVLCNRYIYLRAILGNQNTTIMLSGWQALCHE